MDIKELKFNWNKLGNSDPLWAIITDPNKKGNKWEIEQFFENGRREIEIIINSVHESGIKISRRRALDFGCGVGRLTQAMAQHFEVVHGVDISAAMLKLADKYNQHGSKCEYHLNDTDNLNLFPDNYFDFIYSKITLQHMEPRYSRRYIQEFLRILAPQGLLIFQIPSEYILETDHNNISKINNYLEKTRKAIKQIIPLTLIDLYRRIRYGREVSEQGVMEMYGIKKDDVISLIQEVKEVEIVDVKLDSSAGETWASFQYWVTKV